MATKTSISVFLIFCANSVTLASRPVSISVQERTSNGDLNIYTKGVGDKEGMYATYAVMGHPTRQDINAIVSTVTDGQQTLVKTVRDQNGEMLDCDVNLNDDRVQQFIDRIESSMENLMRQPKMNESKLPAQIQSGEILENIQEKAAMCERFIQARADEQGIRSPSRPQSVPVELDEDQEMDEEDGDPKRRQKRAYLIWPGTNWCGKGSKADFSESYGEHVETDKCCQKHDQCPYIIEGFTTKYGLFNYRIHTLSICDCDEKFMNCLQAANTSTSVMVGKVFFNVVNTECFDLKLQKTCAKRNWWGGCEKYTTKWTAGVRSLGNFPEN